MSRARRERLVVSRTGFDATLRTLWPSPGLGPYSYDWAGDGYQALKLLLQGEPGCEEEHALVTWLYDSARAMASAARCRP